MRPTRLTSHPFSQTVVTSTRTLDLVATSGIHCKKLWVTVLRILLEGKKKAAKDDKIGSYVEKLFNTADEDR